MQIEVCYVKTGQWTVNWVSKCHMFQLWCAAILIFVQQIYFFENVPLFKKTTNFNSSNQFLI